MSLKFSVVTVVYNGEDAIRKTIESVLQQELAPFEYWILDGGSSDNTVAVAEGYCNAFAAKGVSYRIVSEPDSGIYNAMNKGIKAAKGDFISFLNAGDWYEPDALQNINTFYDQDAFDLVYGGLHYINPDGTVVNKMSKLDSFPITSRHWNHPSMFLKRDIYSKYYFDEAFKAYADFDLYLKLRKDGTKIRVIDKVITNFVAGGVSTDASIRKVLTRAKEKYTAYRHNGYSRVYWLESYGWELMKAVYFLIRS